MTRLRLILLSSLCLFGGLGIALRAQRGEKRIVPVDAASVQSFERQTKLAVLVGIGAYPDGSGLTPLRYPASDVRDLAAELTRQGYAVRQLSDGQATRGVIVRTINQIGGLLDPEQGTILFYFSGHGFARGGVNYLATYGSTVDDLEREGLPIAEVEQILKKSRARRQVMWIDACRNDPGAGARGNETRSFVRLQASEGLRVLYSTRAGSVSWEDESLGHGVFTHFLLKGIRGEAKGQDGLVTMQDLAGYVSESVLNYGVQTGRFQRPFEAGESSGDFLIARVGAIPTPTPKPPAPEPAPPKVVAAPKPPTAEPVAVLPETRTGAPLFGLEGKVLLKGMRSGSAGGIAIAPGGAMALVWDGVFLADDEREMTLVNLKDRSFVNRWIGHKRRISNAVFSADGAQALSLDEFEHELILWQVETGTIVRRFFKPNRACAGAPLLAMSGDGRFAVSGGGYSPCSNSLDLWDVSRGVWLADFGATLPKAGQKAVEPTALALSRDGGQLAAGFINGAMQVWDVSTRRVTGTGQCPFPGAEVSQIGWTEKGIQAACSVSKNANTPARSQWLLFSASLGNPISWREWEADILLSPDGDRIASISPGSPEVYGAGSTGAPATEAELLPWLWQGVPRSFRSRLQSLLPEFQALEPNGRVFANSEGKYLVSAGKNRMSVWSVRPLRRVSSVPYQHHVFYHAIALSPAGTEVAAGKGGTVKIFSVPELREREWKAHESEIEDLAFSPDGRRLATVCERDRTLRVWDSASGTLIREWTKLGVEYSGPHSVAFLDGNRLATGISERGIQIRDVTSGALLLTLPSGGLAGMGRLVGTTLYPTPDHASLVVSEYTCCNGSIRIWPLSGGAGIPPVLGGNDMRVKPVALIPGLPLVAAGVDQGWVRFFDMRNRRLLRTWEGHAGELFGLAVLDQGRILASASTDGKIYLRDMRSGSLLAAAVSFGDGESWIAFTPEGYYDGGGAGPDAMLIHTRRGLVSAMSVSGEYRKPERIQAALDGAQAFEMPALAVPKKQP
jgi:WD40 repeat protein